MSNNIKCYCNQHETRYAASVTAKAKRKGAYHHGDLRRSLIDAALKLAKTHGARAVSLTGAATLLGVSGAAPYRHFADKEALLAAAATEAFTGFREALRTPRLSTTDPLEGLLRQGEAYVLFGQKYPERLDLMFNIGLEFRKYLELAEASNAAFNELISAVTALADARLIAASDIDSTAHQVWFLAHGAATLSLPQDSTVSATVALRQAVEAMLLGKRAYKPQP